MSGDEIFGYGWREDHARAGDLALSRAEELAGRTAGTSMPTLHAVLASVEAFAAIAQAHYAAANIRTRPIRDAELP